MKVTYRNQISHREKSAYVEVCLTAEHDRVVYSGAELLVGHKSTTEHTDRTMRMLVRRIIREAQRLEISHIALQLNALQGIRGKDATGEQIAQLVAENALLSGYVYRAYKSKKPKGSYQGLVEVLLVGERSAAVSAALARGTLVAQEMNRARDLSNMPGGDMTPTLLARSIQKAAAGTGARVTVLKERDIKALKMGALLGVARGAKEQPTFTIVEYWGAKRSRQPVVLVGKGITFDTGGLSLKPADYMLDMHLDMAGGAIVAHAAIAAARLKLPVNVVALVPAAENAVSGESYRPGDVLTSMSGKTIDVLNTDAEGRLILADALTYAKRYKPSLVIDVATLTGASLVALGTKCSAVLSKDEAITKRLCELGEASGDYVWPLPLWDEYKPMVEGRFGDVSNVPVKSGRYGGTIGAGMFLAEFADGYPWAHIDMAPRMVSDDGDNLAPGATGEPMRLLVRILSEHR